MRAKRVQNYEFIFRDGELNILNHEKYQTIDIPQRLLEDLRDFIESILKE